jgi:hypothetical protein
MMGYREYIVFTAELQIKNNSLAEAYIIESLVELADRSTSLDELVGLFTVDRVMEGLKVVMDTIRVSPLVDSLDIDDGLLSRAFTLADEVTSKLEPNLRCLSSFFSTASIVAYHRYQHSYATPSVDPPLSINPTLFTNIVQLIKRGTLSGSAWTTRSGYEPVIIEAFHLFHQSIAPNVEKFTDCSPAYRIRDFLQNHPRPYLLPEDEIGKIIKHC